MLTVDLGRLGDGIATIVERQLRADVHRAHVWAVKVMARLEKEAIRIAKERDHVDTQAYIRGFEVKPTSDGAELLNDVPYAGHLEVGLEPGTFPNREKLHGWVMRKLVARGTIAPDEADRVTDAIRLKIHRVGLPPRMIMLDALEDGGNGMPDSGWMGPSDWIPAEASKSGPARDVTGLS